MPKGPSICTSTGFQKPSSNRGHGKYAQEQHFFDKTFTSSFLHSPCVVCINCLTPDKILPCNLGEKFIEYLPRNLESFRCAIYAFRVFKIYFIYKPSPLMQIQPTVGTEHCRSSIQVYWSCAQCSFFEENSHLCFFRLFSPIFASQLTAQKVTGEEATLEFLQSAHLLSPSILLEVFLF